MMLLGFDTTDIVYESPNSIIYRAKTLDRTANLILKVLKGDRPIPMEISAHLIEINGQTYGLSILRDVSKRKRMEAEREQLIRELRQALQEVKRLEGILPTCSYCKRIRDDGGEWHQFELYIRDRSQAEFSHGICPECKEIHFGKLPSRSS